MATAETLGRKLPDSVLTIDVVSAQADNIINSLSMKLTTSML